jgi:hypothetical protein
VFALNPDRGELELASVHPGVSVDAVQAATGFVGPDDGGPPRDPGPTPEELCLIRTEVDPLGMRRLELVAGKERAPLLAALIESEEGAIAELIGGEQQDAVR